MDDDATAYVQRTTTALRDEAERIAVACAAYGIEVRPSATHYRLVTCTSARETRDRLLARSGILVRDCTSFGLPEWIRVAARAPADNDVLITAVRSHLI
jgi:histidinol-phosphate/aromatic aminotransferase/cobyric acid decarboxylase-like protein